MLRVEDVKFSEQEILNGGRFLLADLTPTYKKTHEGSEERAGTIVTVSLTGQHFKTMDVTINDNITCQAFDFIDIMEIEFVEFEAFCLRIDGGEYEIIAQATNFKVVSEE